MSTRIDQFTQAMRQEFLTAWQQLSLAPAPWEDFTTVIPSGGREENYSWMAPVPGMARWTGQRRFGNLDSIKYNVPNVEYDAAFSALIRDIDDDKVGGYKTKPQELARKAKEYPGRLVLKQLSLGGSLPGFDGTNFFADTHTIGSGDNNLTYDCTSNDGVSHKLVMLFNGGPLKPLIYQDRKGPQFETDSGSPQSKERKDVRYWIDLEGAAAFGYWWDAILVTITDTPSFAECEAIIGACINAFRTFQAPKARSSDETEYPHEQTQFSKSNCKIIISGTGCEYKFKRVLTMPDYKDTGGPITSQYYGLADLIVSNYLN